MARLVEWMIMGALAWWAWRRWFHEETPDRSSAPPTTTVTPPPSVMVPCALCGMHLPQEDAVCANNHGPAGQAFYCSAAHAQQAAMASDTSSRSS